MKVAVSVGGKFHAFYLAEQLQKRDMLSQLITSYPKFEVVKSGIHPQKISTVVLKELLERGFRKLPSRFRDSYNPQFTINDLFDRFAAKRLRHCDLFVGWSSFCLNSLEKAKRLGALTIVERGSSHIEYQRDILATEYEKYGLKAQLPHPRIVEKELEEYETADYISVPSLFAKRSFLEKGFPESKIVHVPYGVSLSQFKPVPKEDDVFRVIHCGSLSLRKGCHYLIQAFVELNLPNAELWFVGTVTDEIKPFLNKHNHPKIKLFGHQPQSRLNWFYSQSNVFTLLSIEEGLAMVQAQAMACGLPLICTTNTGGEDLIRDGIEGFIIPIRNIDILKKKILYLYEHSDLCEEMGRNAYKRVESLFTWNNYGSHIIDAYNQIIRAQFLEKSQYDL
jgi:glycosyltransferase involved in cell wall biosynthesis